MVRGELLENHLFLIAAAVIVIISRRSMLHPSGAATEVLMPATESPNPTFSTHEAGRPP